VALGIGDRDRSARGSGIETGVPARQSRHSELGRSTLQHRSLHAFAAGPLRCLIVGGLYSEIQSRCGNEEQGTL